MDAFAAQGTIFAMQSATHRGRCHRTLRCSPVVRSASIGRVSCAVRFSGGAFRRWRKHSPKAGYVTAGFTANTFWAGRQTRLNRGFVHWEDFYRKPGDALVRTVLGRKIAYEFLPKFGQIDIPGRMRAGDINERLFRWLDRTERRPFFAFLNYMDVHGPYLPPAPYAGRFGGPRTHVGKTIELGAVTDETALPPPDLLRDWVNQYDESILALDAGVGALLQASRVAASWITP